MKNKAILGIIIFLLVGGIALGWFFLQKKVIRGKVIDVVSKEPLEGITVKAGDKSTKTNEKGKFHFSLFEKVDKIKVKSPKKYEKEKQIPVSEEPIAIELTPTLLETNKRIERARKRGNFEKIWPYLHPDDKKTWVKKEYKRRVMKGDSSRQEIGQEGLGVKEVGEWKHPFYDRTYQQVKKIFSRDTPDKLSKFLSSEFWQETGGYYHYFSNLLPPSKKEEIMEKIKVEEDKSIEKTNLLSIREVLKKTRTAIGRKIAWVGTIVQIWERKDATFAVVRHYPSGKMFIVRFYGTTDLLSEDAVTVKGVVESITSYKSQADWTMTAPVIRAVEMEE